MLCFNCDIHKTLSTWFLYTAVGYPEEILRLTRETCGTAVFNMSQAHQTLDQLFTQQDFDSCNFTISRMWANYTDTSFEVILCTN